MLARLFSNEGSLEDVELQISLLDEPDAPLGADRFGHPLQLRGVLRDGSRLLLGLNRTECAALYLMFRDHPDIRGWAARLEAQARLLDETAALPGSH